MEETLGFDEVVGTAVDIVQAADQLVSALKDGVQIADLATLFLIAPKVNEIRKRGKTAVAQLIDLSADEAETAAAQISQRTGVPQNRVIRHVNESFVLLARTYKQYRSAELLAADWIRWAKVIQAEVKA